MITAAELSKKVNDFLKTSVGKATISANFFSSSNLKYKMEAHYDAAIESLGEYIEAYMPESLKGSVAVKDILSDISEPHMYPNGTIEIYIYSNKSALRRLSLKPKEYDDVYDIVGLFVNGWNLDPEHKKIWGRWEKPDGTLVGKHIPNKLYQEPTDFIKKAVEEFMATDAKALGVIDCIIGNQDYIAG